jgi:hypothetical protein
MPPPYDVELADGTAVLPGCYSGLPTLAIESDASGVPFSLTPTVDGLPVSLSDDFPIVVTGLGTFTVDTAGVCSVYSGSVDRTKTGTLTVVKDQPIITLDQAFQNVPYGQTYFLAVTLSNLNSVPVTGTVMFNLNGTNNPLTEGTVTISNGEARWSPCSLTQACEVLSPGTYPVDVQYSGNSENEAYSSSQGTFSLQIIKSETRTTIQNCPATEIPIGTSYGFIVQVASAVTTNAVPDPLDGPWAPSLWVGANETLPSGDVTALLPLQLNSLPGQTFSTATFNLTFSVNAYGDYGLIAIYEGSSTTPTDDIYPGDQYYRSSTSANCPFSVND